MIEKPTTINELLELINHHGELELQLERLHTEQVMANNAQELGIVNLRGIPWNKVLKDIAISRFNIQEKLSAIKPHIDKCIKFAQYVGLDWYEHFICYTNQDWINQTTDFRTVPNYVNRSRTWIEPKPTQFTFVSDVSPIATYEVTEYRFREYGVSGAGSYFIATNEQTKTVLIIE